ncbi:hypothetical protein ABVT39_001828 [Epinephelus coioides]
MNRRKWMNVEQALAMRQDISNGESDGGEVIEGETDGGDTVVEMREEGLDEGETDDPSFSPGEEESSEEEDLEPAFRKRPRPPVAEAPPASPSQSLEKMGLCGSVHSRYYALAERSHATS